MRLPTLSSSSTTDLPPEPEPIPQPPAPKKPPDAKRPPRKVEETYEKKIRRELLSEWRLTDQSAQKGIAAQFAPLDRVDGFLFDEVQFVIHAHNKMVLHAIIEEAEARGIDMKKWVIADTIHGPVTVTNQSPPSRTSPKSSDEKLTMQTPRPEPDLEALLCTLFDPDEFERFLR